jgi:TolA-binding protein
MKKLIYIGVTLIIIVCLLMSASCSSKTTVTDSMLGEFSRGTTLFTKTPAPNISVTSPSTSSGEGLSYSTDSQRMIVRTGNMTLVVSDIATTLDRIAKLAEDSKGYVVSSNKWKDSGRLVGTITIRVPTGQFDSAMSTLRGMADEVTSENTSAQDVTEEYTDMSAKLKNLEATEAQLLEIMKKAEKVEDILAVQRQLSSTRDEIERTKGRMQYLEKTSETSLITVQLTQSKLDVKLTAISGRNVRGGENVFFNAEISGGFSPYNYKWDFGDKSTSTEESPVHAYSSSGKFSVSLTITDDKGNTATDTRNDYITVQSGWNIGNVAKTAWKGLSVFIHALVNVLIWLGIFSPVWLIGGGIGYLIWRRRKKKKAKTN